MKQDKPTDEDVPKWGSESPSPDRWRTPDEIVAMNVRRIRDLRGLSGRQLEERTGLRGRFVSDLERGRISATITEVVRIALALSVSPLALVLPWDEGADEGTVLYIQQATFGLIFPEGSEGVEAAARLWTGRLSPAFAHLVNGHEYRTTLPSFTRDRDDVGEATILDDGTLVYHDGPKGIPQRDVAGELRYSDGTRLFDAPDRGATVVNPDRRTSRPRGWPDDAPSLSLARDEEWSWDRPSEPKVELIEEGPLFERLQAARETSESDESDDKRGSS